MQSFHQHIQGTRIHARIEELAQIGNLPSGAMNRYSYSQDDKDARLLFLSWLEELDMEVRVDPVGNIIGKLDGKDPELPHILVGSHLDTQPNGGKFDGIAGCLAAIEMVQAFKAAGTELTHTIEVVVWAGEEGSGRFDVGLIGSRAMVGTLTQSHLDQLCRFRGITLREAMEEVGEDPKRLALAMRKPSEIHAVLEMHIEQGPYLEAEGIPIGVVTGIAGNRRIPFSIQGVQAHSGALPMKYRKDALCAMAEIILAAEQEAENYTKHNVVATTGYSKHSPQVIAIVPGEASGIIDVRSTDLGALEEVTNLIISRMKEIAGRRDIICEIGDVWGMDPEKTSQHLAGIITSASNALGIDSMPIDSGAGHDSLMMAKLAPAGMIFVPSVNGISHAPEELTHIDDLVAGTQVLAESVFQLSEASQKMVSLSD